VSARAPATDRGSALQDMPRQKAVVAVLCLVAVALVVTAWLAESYVPLFFVWVPQLGIPFYLSRSSRRRAGTATPG